ncbi:S8 family serine peptidase [Methylobacterium symbioticum]|uniref:Extracellular serine protease n=2 Tax=Pseudomonadota TaxID=1224 RepID=A0A509E726_9HYPH|nr:S8 family serine peptidase [Methylobacterium symbioticum]VUD69981.1 Extracellular serine protease [Methylobacterium symbioticum]
MRRGAFRAGLLAGFSLAALSAALGPAAAQTLPARSPSTEGLTAAQFDTPEYRADYGLAHINAATAYARGFTGLGVTVAVVDTGIDPSHPEFRGRLSPFSRNFIPGEDPTRLFDTDLGNILVGHRGGHGTHVAGTVGAARDGVGMMGVAFDSTILSLFNLLDTTSAIRYATQQNARVLNGSYGPSFPRPWDPDYVRLGIQPVYGADVLQHQAIKEAVDRDMLLVFAAGNDRQTQPDISHNPSGAALYPYIRPANAGSGVYQFFDHDDNPVDQSRIDFSDLAGSIISVVAVDRNNAMAPFSNLCGVTAAWCIAAPGFQIYSTLRMGTSGNPADPDYGLMSGTSMAAPHVAGAAAVLRQAFPFLTAPQIAQTLLTTATHLGDGPVGVPNDTFGWGLLNLGKAIDGPGQFTATWTVNTQGYAGRFANDISGVGGLIKTGLGTLELAGDNTYAGGTAIYGGTLAVSRDANLGAAGTGLTLGGGTLEVLADGFASARPLTLTGTGTLQIDGGSARFSGVMTDGAQAGLLVKAGAGTLALTGTGHFSGPTIVQAGTLALDGIWSSPVMVAAAGTLRGTGTIAASVAVAGALRPGHSPGTLTVLGPVSFAPGSTFGIDIDGPSTGSGAGNFARLLALGPSGTVSANGTLVPVLRGISGDAGNGFTPALGQRFDVLAAQAGLSGSFTGLVQPTAGLASGTRFDALYAANGLELVVTPTAYGNLAGFGLIQTGNARAVGAALDLARPEAGTRPDAARARVYDPLYAAAPATLPGGLASLSGQSYGDAMMTDLAARRLIADTVDRHLRGTGGGGAAFSTGEPGLGPNRSALQVRGGAGAPDQPLAAGEGRIWADALYGFGARSGDRSAAGAAFDAGGLILGVDRQVGPDTLVGAAFSYLRESGRSDGAGLGRFATDSYGGALYASTRLGAVVLRGVAGASYADGRIDRTTALGAAVSQASGLAAGWNAGVSGFAGYALATGLPLELVPEVGFSYDRLTRARVAEQGGLAGQSFAGAELDAARSLVGGRVTSLPLAGSAGLRLEGRAYWAHELADTSAVVRSSLFGAPFTTRTSALGRDGAVLGVSLTGPVAEGVALSLSYAGELRPGANAQVVTAGLQARW